MIIVMPKIHLHLIRVIIRAVHQQNNKINTQKTKKKMFLILSTLHHCSKLLVSAEVNLRQCTEYVPFVANCHRCWVATSATHSSKPLRSTTHTMYKLRPSVSCGFRVTCPSLFVVWWKIESGTFATHSTHVHAELTPVHVHCSRK